MGDSVGIAERTGGFADYRDDPVAFVREVLPEAGVPYPKQAEMMRLAVSNRRVSVVGCNGSGKDWAVARLVLWWVETRTEAKAVVTGPTQRQVDEVVWREMRLAYAMAGHALSGRMQRSRYEVGADRFALGFSTDQPYNLQGFHSPNLLVAVTEAHAVEQEHMDALKRLNPNLLILTGNALVMVGEFYESHHARRNLYAAMRISAFDTPNFIEGAGVVIPGMLTPDDVEERKKEWDEESDSYRASVLAEFVSELRNSLVSRAEVSDAAARWAEPAPDEPGAPWLLGVDVARYGGDKTALCLRRGQRVESIKTVRGADTMEVVALVVEQARRYGVRAVFVDGVGVGGGVVDRLRELGMPAVDVQAGSKARNAERFVNLRAELFWGLRERFREGRIVIPDDSELTTQLLALQYKETESGRIQLARKDDIRRRGLPSLDKADALALAFMPEPATGVWL
ncbi:MAG: hypothetical protein J4F32_04075 [Dehalococcoidia bacterium]|nr:hypothetical protein [Dehalococcoidia bacterium]